MNPNVPYDPTSALGAIATGGLVALVISIGFVALVLCLYYLFFKACVRNGVIEALKKTGYVDELGHRTYAPVAAPQAHAYGAPAAPSYQPPAGGGTA